MLVPRPQAFQEVLCVAPPDGANNTRIWPPMVQAGALYRATSGFEVAFTMGLMPVTFEVTTNGALMVAVLPVLSFSTVTVIVKVPWFSVGSQVRVFEL